MDIKELYARSHDKQSEQTLQLNKRLFSTYNRITKRILQKELAGVNVDLGSGDKGFSAYCASMGITSYPYDYPDFNIEKDKLIQEDSSVDFVTMNAVLEHIHKPDHIFAEAKRVLKSGGLIFIRTPNWQMDYKNFYNDPTHVTPYTPKRLETLFKLSGFSCIFLEPGLIEKSWIYWQMPERIKWKAASVVKGGTKSILGVGYLEAK